MPISYEQNKVKDEPEKRRMQLAQMVSLEQMGRQAMSRLLRGGLAFEIREVIERNELLCII